MSDKDSSTSEGPTYDQKVENWRWFKHKNEQKISQLWTLCQRLTPVWSSEQTDLILSANRGTSLYQQMEVHSPSKCLAWVQKCCHVWLDKNFDPSLLTSKVWLVFMGKKAKKKFFFRKKNSKWPTQKKLIFQNGQFSKFFASSG